VLLATFMTSWMVTTGTAQRIREDRDSTVSTEVHREKASIPSNLVATSVLRPVIEMIWRESSTFKAQCARLKSEPLVLVDIRFGNASLNAGRARTDFVRAPQGGTRAQVSIYPKFRSLAELIELIGHEVEHVIEHLDEVDLEPSEAHGVRQTALGTFETARAIHIGQRVSREVYGANSGSW
jgi:hypothetical protein